MDTITVLAIDDEPMSLGLLKVMLSDLHCTFHGTCSCSQALDLLGRDVPVDVILLDLEMPVMNGFEMLQVLKRHDAWREIPVIVVTADNHEVNRSLSLGAGDFVTKPYNPEELRLRVMNHVRGKKLADLAKDMNATLEREVAKKTAELQKALELSQAAEYEIALRLGKAAEYRDQETGMHIRRISVLAEHLATLAGLPEQDISAIRFAAPLHDVGKIGIPDHILLKAGRLDAADAEVMKQHTYIGKQILADANGFPLLDAGKIIAFQHHERWDGNGYPSGLRGDEIHIYARIITIVDVFDALTSERPYKKAISGQESMRIMVEEMHSHFDPELLHLFINNSEQFTAIKNAMPDDT